MTKIKKITSERTYRELLLEMTNQDYYACKTCGRPVFSGYCCTWCGDTDPQDEANKGLSPHNKERRQNAGKNYERTRGILPPLPPRNTNR